MTEIWKFSTRREISDLSHNKRGEIRNFAKFGGILKFYTRERPFLDWNLGKVQIKFWIKIGEIFGKNVDIVQFEAAHIGFDQFWLQLAPILSSLDMTPEYLTGFNTL